MGDVAHQKDATSLASIVRAATGALSALVPHAAGLGAGVAEAIQSVTHDIEPALRKTTLSLVIVGDAVAQRALLRALLGDVVSPTSKHKRVTRIRAAETFDYVAHMRDGTTVRFARTMPDKDPVYKESLEEAERGVLEAIDARKAIETEVERSRSEVRVAEATIADLEAELETAGDAFAQAWRAQKAADARLAEIEKAEPQVPRLLLAEPPWWALWLFLWRILLRRKWREPLALHAHNRAQAAVSRARASELTTEAEHAEARRDALRGRRDEEVTKLERAQSSLARVEVTLSEEASVAAAHARVEQLVRERSRHAGERKEEFFSDLREMDGTARGDAVVELDVELPENHSGAPPPEVMLVLFGTPSDHDHDGLAGVRSNNKEDVKTDGLGLPLVAVLTMRPSGDRPVWRVVRDAVARVKDSRLVQPAKAAMRLRACIAEVARAHGDAEAEHQRRLASLEGQRIPHPDEFRKRQIARSEPAIEKGADDVLADALTHVEAGFAALKNEWLAELAGATSKRRIDACISDINQRGKMRVLELIEATSELIAREMQSVGETLERWALDEIQTSYRTTKRMRAESLAPVASDVTGEDLAAPIATLVPIRGAREAFRRQRIVIGLAGALACAGAGTFVRPGLGTAVGAGVGLFSAFFKPSSSLRSACLEQIEAYVAGASSKTCAALRDKRPALAVGIGASLDEALKDTLERLNDSITRLMRIERDAIAQERSMLANLSTTRGTLEQHEAGLRDGLAAFESAIVRS